MVKFEYYGKLKFSFDRCQLLLKEELKQDFQFQNFEFSRKFAPPEFRLFRKT